ncbi:hypothetical protein OS493_026899 [Desmophyllum pertusum]|uniref:Uncharacterized protein n=1 Tax=Desmophyllum pertusum TaxID=174260 RepID=A0A9W9Z9U5_9CNID|nr:hypothetical protein OS493_026899 [Desmophyllum pertusum]
MSLIRNDQVKPPIQCTDQPETGDESIMVPAVPETQEKEPNTMPLTCQKTGDERHYGASSATEDKVQ